MKPPRLEVADVVRRFGRRFLRACGRSLSMAQRRVLWDVATCRTAARGGHVAECDGCGLRRIAYNSCRNRHCPKCQSAARIEWTERRESELLPVPYMHLVFTLPSELQAIALQNKQVVYGLLFKAAAETVQEVAADPKHLGGRVGFLAVLHTWGQNLMHHPHLHCVVPAGGLSPNGSRWIACRRSAATDQLFFLPVRVLSRVFRGKFVQGLKRAHVEGRLSFHGRIKHLAEAVRFEQQMNRAVRQDWVVYAKRPFGGPRQVLRYLARYTHRVAISNHRLIDADDGRVRFHWKDYVDGGARKTMTLDAVEFIRRFLLHTLPRGFRRIRYYGFMANRNRRDNVALCRRLLDESVTPATNESARGSSDDVDRKCIDDGNDLSRCPACRTGRLVIIESLPAALDETIQGPHFLRRLRTHHHKWYTS